MSTKSVTELRKSGKLKEAHELAIKNIEAEPDSIQAKNDLAWCYYALLKQVIESPRNHREMMRLISEIKLLRVPGNNTMFYEQLAYLIGNYLFVLFKNKYEANFVEEIAMAIYDIPFPRPCDGYSYMLNGFNKYSSKWGKFYIFVETWGLKNLQPKDYQETHETDSKGKTTKYKSLAEKTINAYCKKIISLQDKDRCAKILPALAIISESYPNYEYIPYYQAQIKLLVGEEKSEILKGLMPFARKKSEMFWVWSLIADIYKEEPAMRLACLARAITCKGADDKFLIGTRRMIIPMLVDSQQYGYAKHEVDILIETYRREGWGVPSEVLAWQSTSWYKDSQSADGIREYYRDLQKNTESIIPIKSELEKKEVQGKVVIREGKDYGFVGGKIYVPKAVIDKYNLVNGDMIEGIAIQSYDKKKDKMGWKLTPKGLKKNPF